MMKMRTVNTIWTMDKIKHGILGNFDRQLDSYGEDTTACTGRARGVGNAGALVDGARYTCCIVTGAGTLAFGCDLGAVSIGL